MEKTVGPTTMTWPSYNTLWNLVNFPVNPNLVDARIPADFVQCHLQVEERLKDICKSFDIKVISYFRLIADCIFYNVIKHTALKS